MTRVIEFFSLLSMFAAGYFALLMF